MSLLYARRKKDYCLHRSQWAATVIIAQRAGQQVLCRGDTRLIIGVTLCCAGGIVPWPLALPIGRLAAAPRCRPVTATWPIRAHKAELPHDRLRRLRPAGRQWRMARTADTSPPTEAGKELKSGMVREALMAGEGREERVVIAHEGRSAGWWRGWREWMKSEIARLNVHGEI